MEGGVVGVSNDSAVSTARDISYVVLIRCASEERRKKNMSNSEIPTSSQGKVTQIKIADNEPREIVLLNY